MPAARLPASATVWVEEQLVFTIADLCHATGAGAEQLRALVGVGVLQPLAETVPLRAWQFSGHQLPRARAALRLARDFELDPGAVAMVMELLAEIRQLRSQLQHG